MKAVLSGTCGKSWLIEPGIHVDRCGYSGFFIVTVYVNLREGINLLNILGIKFKNDISIIIISLTFGLLFGVIDSFVSSYFFHDGGFVEQIFTGNYNVIWKRSLVLLICLINGLIVIMLMRYRRKTANDLFESREIFRNVFVHSAAGIAIADLSGSYINVNPSFSMMLGYTVDEMLEKNFRDITHHDDLDADLTFLGQLKSEEINSFSMEKRYVHKNGTPVWAYITVSIIRNSDGAPVYYLSLFNNITDKKEASFIDIAGRDKALFEKNRSFQELNQLFNSIGIGMCLVDRNFNIARINDSFSRLFNRDRDDIIGRRCSEVMPDTLCSSIDCPLHRILQGADGCEFETVKRISDDRVLTFIVTANPFLSPENEIQGITLTFTDITEIRTLEKKISEIGEIERQSIGQLLHDEVGQLITGLIFRVSALKRTISEKAEAEDIQIIEELLMKVQLQVRRLMIGLYPANVEYDRLLVALQHLAVETEKLYNTKCRVIVENESIVITDYTEITQLLYIARESVHNIVKHSKAGNITISLSEDSNTVTLKIKSDSLLESSGVLGKRGMGSRIMEYRAKMIKAKFEQIIEDGVLVNMVHIKSINKRPQNHD